MNLLLFNLKTDADADTQGFTTRWIAAIARDPRVEHVVVLTMYAGRIDVPENVRVFSLGRERGYSEFRRFFRFYRLLLRALRLHRIDACFSHMSPIFSVLAGPVLRVARIPLVTWFTHPSLTWKLKVAHRFSTRMVSAVASSYPYRKDKLVPLGHGIDMDEFPYSPPENEAAKMILCAGRLSSVKGHKTLLRAVALLQGRQSGDVQVAVVGGPKDAAGERYLGELKQLARELRIDDFTQFVGVVPHAEIVGWYRSCTVHVNLTPEGFLDKVALESMVCGRLCLVANPAFRETLGIYGDRLLFEHGNPIDLGDKLRWCLSLSGDQRGEIGAYLRQRVMELHSLDRLADRLVQILHELREKSLRSQI